MPPHPFRLAFLPILVAAAISTLYAAASWSNQFVYDDHEVIENQYPIRHLNDLARIFTEPHYLNFPYYRPVTRTTFALQQMSQSSRSPRAYHLFNALLAGAVMLAAYALLRRRVFDLGPIAALLASSWFALHPAISECVYPAASGRETLLPALLIILTMWAYLGAGPRWFCLAMFLFATSLLSKEQAAVLPALFLAADALRLSEKPQTFARWILRYLPVAAILLLYFFLRQLIFRQPSLHLTIMQHPLEPLKSLLFGIQTGVAPFMALRYEPPFEIWFDPRLAAISCMVVFTMIAISLFPSPGTPGEGRGGGLTSSSASNPRRRVRSPIFWLAWFVLLQLPTAHIVQQEAAYSERYAALAILALPAIAASLFRFSRPGICTVAAGIAILWTILFACVSFFRGDYYTDDASFCIQWQNTSPRAAGPHDGFGRLAQQRHQFPTAIAEYQKALSIQPADATARNNLANLLADAGDFPGASQQYEWLLNNTGSGADPAATLTNYAQLLGQEGFRRHDPTMRDRAHQLLEQAVTLRPDYAQAHYILGEWNIAFGSRDAAIRQFKIALHLRPDWAEVQDKLQKLQESPRNSPPTNAASIP